MHGLANENFKISDKVIEKIITEYTRESGVRELNRQIASIMRYQAKELVKNGSIETVVTPEMVDVILGKPKFINDVFQMANMAGVAIGLAWTYVGGDVLFIEAQLSNGKGEMSLTGNLGNVMKESATTALSWIKANARSLGINEDLFATKNIHIHVPEGATPKDGPSAGITMMSALASAFTSKKIKPYLAMTGEITLRGLVLPVGGIKEKILAAKRSGIKEIILCYQNQRDLEDVNPRFIKGVKFHFVKTMQEVLDIALK